jgi:hypothetical protein
LRWDRPSREKKRGHLASQHYLTQPYSGQTEGYGINSFVRSIHFHTIDEAMRGFDVVGGGGRGGGFDSDDSSPRSDVLEFDPAPLREHLLSGSRKVRDVLVSPPISSL